MANVVKKETMKDSQESDILQRNYMIKYEKKIFPSTYKETQGMQHLNYPLLHLDALPTQNVSFGDFGRVRHPGIAEDNRGIAFLVVLFSREYFFTFNHIFSP